MQELLASQCRSLIERRHYTFTGISTRPHEDSNDEWDILSDSTKI